MNNLQEQLIARKIQLKPTKTVFTSIDGSQIIESYVNGNRRIIKETPNASVGFVIDVKPDLRINEIVNGIFIGSQDVAQELSLIQYHKITHILNVSSGIENFFQHSLTYFNVEAFDTPEFRLVDHINDCICFINKAIKEGGKILVHCNAGISRSSTIVIAFIMNNFGKTFKQSFELVKSKRQFIKPNDGFIAQLKEYENILYNI